MTPRCLSHPHRSSSRRPRLPRRPRRNSSHRRGRSLRRGPGHVCGRSIRPAWWAPSRRHARLPPWWPTLVSWGKILHDWVKTETLHSGSTYFGPSFVGYLMISTYSRSLPLLSLHLRYMTEASTFAGEKVLGSFSSEITLSKMVLGENTHSIFTQKLALICRFFFFCSIHKKKHAIDFLFSQSQWRLPFCFFEWTQILLHCLFTCQLSITWWCKITILVSEFTNITDNIQ